MSKYIYRVPRLDLVISEPEKVHRTNRRQSNQREQLRTSYQNRLQRLEELPHADSAPFHQDQMLADGEAMTTHSFLSSGETAVPPSSNRNVVEPIESEATTTPSTQRRRHRAQHNNNRRRHRIGHHNAHRNNNNNAVNIADVVETTQ